MRKQTKTRLVALGLAGTLALAACGNGGGDTGGGSGKTVTLSFANSYPESHPHNRCGAKVVADKIAKSDTGLEIKIFPNSSLGPDADRFESVVSGDIDIDIQGSSAIAASYPDIGALDAAYLMKGPDDLFGFLDSEVFEQVQADLVEKTGVRALDGWFFGMRQFTANRPIRKPGDLEGLRMRFPDSPQYLQNAKAVGAQAVPVAFEEVYLSLQQGVIDGQENPVPTIEDLNLPEVQSHVSMTAHQTGFVLAIVNEKTWKSLTSKQRKALQDAISSTRADDRKCIEDDERRFLDEWKKNRTVTVVDDVDLETFSRQAEAYFLKNLKGSKLELYKEIRDIAP